MLPTNQKAGALWLNPDTNTLIHTHVSGKYKELYQPQHLYIISDEEIKEGDWKIVFDSLTSTVRTVEIHKHSKDTECPIFLNERKIIATTDESLTINSELSAYYKNELGGGIKLPQPSQSFIEKFFGRYNAGKLITDVMVEYETDQIVGTTTYIGGKLRIVEKIWKSPTNNEWYFDTDNGLDTWSCTSNKLKVNPKDNTITITIKPIKDSLNRKEIIDFVTTLTSTPSVISKETAESMLDNWIEEHL